MPKICFYIANLSKGGAQRVIVNLTEYLLGKEYQVTIVTTNRETVEYELPEGAKRVMSDIYGEEISKSRVRNFYRRFSKLRAIWKTENPDVVISFIGKNNMMAIATNFFTKRPVLISVRANPTMEYYNKVLQFISKTLFVKADGIILQTKEQQDFFPKRIQKNCVILPNPLNPEFVKAPRSDRACKQIVAVGRVDENKNHEMLIKAFEKVAKDYPEWELVIYGDGPDKAKLDQWIEKSSYQDRMSAPGNVSDVATKLQHARIYVLTSSEEGMPNSLMEAMAMGLACISTDCPCGGPAELIQSGENGLLIPIKDVDALECALRNLLADEALEEKLANQAYTIREKLNPEVVYASWQNYIEKISKISRKL